MRAIARHVAVIPDGNRRWARARGLPAPDGHREGIQVVGRNADAAWTMGVELFTFWWGSTANLTKRQPEEVAVITSCLSDWLCNQAPALLRKHDARISVFGRWRDLCPEIEAGVSTATEAAGAGPRELVVLIAYDGREEILAAAHQLAGEVGIEQFGDAMWTGSLPPVDLLIRTGGEPHLSAGFMLWRIAEAQLAFPQVLWPDFGPDELRKTLAEHARVERRFGR